MYICTMFRKKQQFFLFVQYIRYCFTTFAEFSSIILKHNNIQMAQCPKLYESCGTERHVILPEHRNFHLQASDCEMLNI